MGWVLGGFGVLLIIVVVGAAIGVCKRYPVGWRQCGSRDLWIFCEEWRRRLSWLWAPREEKVGLVKAQHPPAQAVPGLYRQDSSNSSQYIMHSDSDLRLDAQGAFTRFEAVDRDLHPPQSTGGGGGGTGTSAATNDGIPPQPLRPAPQPRASVRPRPTPLKAPSGLDYRRLRECDESPLTPPPSLVDKFAANQSRLFHFQTPKSQASKLPAPPLHPPPPPAPEYLERHYSRSALQRSPFFMNDDADFEQQRYRVQGLTIGEQLFNAKIESDCEDYENQNAFYGSYDILDRARSIVDSMYASRTLSSILQQSSRNLDSSIETRNQSGRLQDILGNDIRMSQYQEGQPPELDSYLDRVTRYIQSLPDKPFYPASPTSPTQRSANILMESELNSPAPPPPAPPDPVWQSEDCVTTGEKIFKALRSMSSQSYIDASEFYNSVFSPVQETRNMAFNSAADDKKTISNLEDEENDEEVVEDDRFPSSTFQLKNNQNLISDVNNEVYSSQDSSQNNARISQNKYNNLQDQAPASSVVLKDVDQQAYSSYMTDPSFTRTSEDIFNSLEHRRKSVQESFQELFEMEANNTESSRRENNLMSLCRRRHSHEILSALEEVQIKRRLSLSLDDAFASADYIDYGLSNRRSSLVPEPEPPPVPLLDETSLKHAVSCESVNSDTSVVLNEDDLDEAPVVGLVCVGLEHDRWGGRAVDGEGDLIVSVLEARDLTRPDGSQAQNTYARVCLLPDRQSYVQTRLYRDTNSPSYQEKFLFALDGGPAGRTLLVQIYSVDMRTGESNLLGEASLGLGPAQRPPATTWLPLLSQALPVPQLGELLFSLSYLPTAERLTIVVVKARNLKGANDTPGDFFVKAYLLQEGKKLHKKRTSIKRGEKSPIFNEAIIFNVAAHALQTIQLRLTVAEVSSDLSSKAFSVGHVITGAPTSGKSLVHWRQMLGALRRPVAMWHPLRK